MSAGKHGCSARVGTHVATMMVGTTGGGCSGTAGGCAAEDAGTGCGRDR